MAQITSTTTLTDSLVARTLGTGVSQCYDKDLQTDFYLFLLGVLILESY